MITDIDVKKLKKIFVTKEELKQTEKRLLNSLVEFKDSILKEIIDLRDDVRVVIGYRDMIEDHEQRLTKIEKVMVRS